MEVPNIGSPFVLDTGDIETIDRLLKQFFDAEDRPIRVLDLCTVDSSPRLAHLVSQASGTTRGATIPIIFEPQRRNTWTPDHNKSKGPRPGGRAAIRKTR